MRLLVVVAHPDDESFGRGSILAHAASLGADTAVLCATRGEAGESRVVSDDLAAVREAELRPDVVVTLDGGDGHRDHTAIRDATLAAVDAAADPPTATYLWCVTRTRMARWADHLRATGESEIYLQLGSLGTPDEEVTLVLDLPQHLEKRWEAIRAHASQQSPYENLAPDFQREALCRQDLKLVRGIDALFA